MKLKNIGCSSGHAEINRNQSVKFQWIWKLHDAGYQSN